MQYSGIGESTSVEYALGIRPYCGCCGGGEYRKGYTVTKAKSVKKNRKAYKSKDKKVDRRARRAQRPDKYGD